MALGLLNDDYKQINCLQEASLFVTGAQLQSLFVTALVYSPITNPLALWIKFKLSLCNNLLCILAHQLNLPGSIKDVYLDYSLYLIQQVLVDYGKTLIDYFLSLLQHCWDLIDGNPLIVVELNYSTTKKGHLFIELYSQLNSDQATCFIIVTTTIDIDPQTAHFFLQNSAGTGKTFLYYCICHYYYSYSYIILCIVFFSIAALLLPGN